MEEYIDFLKVYSKENFGLRLSSLRGKKGVSARKMSLELGQNKNYINGIESGNHFPAMQCFFDICYYLNVTPAEFFKGRELSMDCYDEELIRQLYQLPPDVFQHFSQIIDDLSGKIS